MLVYQRVSYVILYALWIRVLTEDVVLLGFDWRKAVDQWIDQWIFSTWGRGLNLWGQRSKNHQSVGTCRHVSHHFPRPKNPLRQQIRARHCCQVLSVPSALDSVI